MAPLINAGVGVGSMFLPGGQARGLFGRGNRGNTGVTGGRYGYTPGTGSAGAGYYGVF